MADSWLRRTLASAQEWGFLGPGPVEQHLAHAELFWRSWEDLVGDPPGALLDLGSGGGVPGLILLERWQRPTVLLDAMQRRAAFLERALCDDAAPAGGVVWLGRAEELAREGRAEEAFDLVTARSFGPPAVTAECAARFLRVGGLLIVSEPPDSGMRWPADGVARLGLRHRDARREPLSVEILEKVAPTPEPYPRRIGVPAKRPLF